MVVRVGGAQGVLGVLRVGGVVGMAGSSSCGFERGCGSPWGWMALSVGGVLAVLKVLGDPVAAMSSRWRRDGAVTASLAAAQTKQPTDNSRGKLC